jgi:hypothetical protein
MGGNRKTGAGQGLTWHSTRFILGGIQLLDMSRVTSLSGFSGASNRNLLIQATDTLEDCGACRRAWGAIGVRLRLEKNMWRTSASKGGGMLDVWFGFIEAPYSIGWDWEIGTSEARREPGFLGGGHRLWKI